MSTDHGFAQTSGYLRIGRITSINPDTFRCDLEFPGTYSIARDVPINPSPLMGFMPETGSHVAVYSRPGMGNRILLPLDSPGTRTPEEFIENENKPGTIPNMETGDSYFGHRGRAYFNKHGDARLSSSASRATLELKAEKAKAELYAYNFDLFTPGRNVRIHSKSTTAIGPLQTWGDSLELDVNIPLAPGVDSAVEIPPTSLGKIKIGNTGNIGLNVLPPTGLLDLPGVSHLSMDTLGQIEIGHGPAGVLRTSGLSISALALGDVELFTPTSSLLLSKTLSLVSLENAVASTRLTMDGIGNATLGTVTSYVGRDGMLLSTTMKTPLASISAYDSGLISLIGPASSISMDVAGNSIFAGNNVSINAAVAASMTAAASLSLAAPLISLGLVSGGHVAFAEALALVLQQLNVLHLAIKTHTHAFAGVVVSGLGAGGNVIGGVLLPGGTGSGGTTPSAELAAPGLIPPTPSAAAIGSTTVTAQV